MSYEKLSEWIGQSGNIVFFGGAGVSTESGIPDFRSENGIYQAKSRYGYPPEQIISHGFFYSHTDVFYGFYKSMMVYPDARPNAAHLALARLERLGRLKAVVTQNIDGLHQMAGSRNVIELHGTIHSNYCTKCGKFFDLGYIVNADGVPRCDACGGIVKPDVVLYEEQLKDGVIEKAVEAMGEADMLIVAGTSLSVYPAAGLIQYYRGNRLVLINKSPTPYDDNADLLICDKVGKVLSEVV